MLFKQLFEPLSSTYTYLIACEETRQAILIDPVIATIGRDLAELKEYGLTLRYAIDTHIHADHITSALELKKKLGSKIANPIIDRLPCADVYLEEGKPLEVGSIQLHSLHTPGHTAGHFAYVINNQVFTGDSLLIDGCGRTDFQHGSSEQQYQSINQKLFNLPNDFLVYPGHDYQNRFVSTIGQERIRNPRLGEGKSLEEFISIMDKLNLPYPKFIDFAVPGNTLCGVCPTDLPNNLEAYCRKSSESIQG
ncbi:MAG: MBL fold metallo-hydrolase [Methylotenera sp.]|uniref:MBL fold metallo-hydrolase n=1 Tax=Methylotenera sp. TaxID=2051956 RepID=UPI00248710CE|nr:MBL fold metallo-hydrolase [Methylotenera sp.]MDI1310193.1 MBL fold metallo-hydrolase [Methylotenera sp.]